MQEPSSPPPDGGAPGREPKKEPEEVTFPTEDLKDVFKDAFKERLANPFFSAFVFAWVVCNWRTILLVMLARPTTRESLADICPTDFSWPKAVLWPAAGALSYTLLSPIVYHVIHRYNVIFHTANQKVSVNSITSVRDLEFQLADELDKKALKLETDRARRRQTKSNSA